MGGGRVRGDAGAKTLAHVAPTAAQVNRANQLNPKHSAFWSARGIEHGPTPTVYHGTSASKAAAIMKEGFKPSKSGLLGQGIYVTTDQSKAQAFAGTDGAVVRAVANPGNMKVVDARGAREHGHSESSWQKAHDSAFVPKGEGVARPEHCIKDPQRVSPVGVLPQRAP